MAQLAFLIPYAVAAVGTLLQGASAKGAAKSEALQLEQNAGQARAASQLDAIGQRRSARYLQSRALALAAASGAGASDPTTVNVLSSIEGEGEFRALASLYEGESSARGMEFGAKVRNKEGKAAETASTLKAAGTLLGGASSWADKYGGGGAPGSAFTSSGAVRQSINSGTSISDFGINSARYA